MQYELWDTKSGNLINTFSSKRGALNAVQALGSTYGEDLAMVSEGADGETHMVAEGVSLLHLAAQFPDDASSVATSGAVLPR